MNNYTIVLGDKSRSFQLLIGGIVQYEKFIVIRLENMDGRPLDCRNIFAVDDNGKELWRIAPPDPDPSVLYELYYKGIVENHETGELFAFDNNSIRYHLDPETGKILSREFVK